MDSGFGPSGAPRNDAGGSCAQPAHKSGIHRQKLRPKAPFTPPRDWREACTTAIGTPAGAARLEGSGGGRMPVGLAFDEMKGTDGQVRAPYSELSKWLGDVRPDVLDYRRREAELLFRRIGITFAVYGEADSTERLIPFDVIPRILAAREWDLLRKGLEQRVKAINALSPRHLRPPRSAARRHRAGRPGVPESGVPAGDERPEGAAQHLRPHRRHRHRPRRSGDLLRSRRQRAHALRRLLHAGEPRDHDAAVSGAVLAAPRVAGRELSGRIARDAEVASHPNPPPAIRPSRCSRPASTTRPITSTHSWPTSSASTWSRAATCSSSRASSTCARRRGRSAST